MGSVSQLHRYNTGALCLGWRHGTCLIQSGEGKWKRAFLFSFSASFYPIWLLPLLPVSGVSALSQRTAAITWLYSLSLLSTSNQPKALGCSAFKTDACFMPEATSGVTIWLRPPSSHVQIMGLTSQPSPLSFASLGLFCMADSVSF